MRSLYRIYMSLIGVVIVMCFIEVTRSAKQAEKEDRNYSPCQKQTRKLDASPSFFHTPHSNSILEQTVIVVIVGPPIDVNDTACTFDIGDVVRQVSAAKDEVLYISLQCMSSDVRLVLDNPSGVVNKHLIGYLALSGCAIYWRDLAIYGDALDFRVLFLSRWKDIFTEEQEVYPRNDSETCVYAPGLENLGTLGFIQVDSDVEGSEDLPSIFNDEYICWPNMAEISFHGIPYPSPPNTLSTRMPRLQSIEAREGHLKQPPNFPWNNQLLKLPRNLSRSEVGNDHYSTAEGIDVPPDYYRRLLSLDNNKITDLSSFEINGLLHKISLTGNKLHSVGANTFNGVEGLQVIDLSSNSLTDLPITLFQNLILLKQLNLKYNDIEILVMGTFSNLTSLKLLNIANNKLVAITASIFSDLRSLEIIDLSNNQISMIDNSAIFLESLALTQVVLGGNQIVELPSWLFLVRSLKYIDLADNKVTFPSILKCWSKIEKEYFIYQNRRSASQFSEIGEPSHEKMVDLTQNNITEVSLNNLSAEIRDVFPLVFAFYKLDIRDNPVWCGFSAFTFHKFITGSHEFSKLQYKPNQFNVDNWKCENPNNVRDIPIAEAPLATFKYIVLVKDCPTGCKCYNLPDSTDLDIDCSHLDLTELPDTVPQRTKILRLAYNRLNCLTEPKWYFGQLRLLDLSYNQIYNVSNEAINNLTSLETFMVNNNRLSYLPDNITELSQLQSLHLHINPLVCDCKSGWLSDWFKNKLPIIEKASNIFCSNSGKLLQNTVADDFLCKPKTFSSTQISNTALDVGIALACSIVLVVILVLLVVCLVHRRRNPCHSESRHKPFPVCSNGGNIYQLTVEENHQNGHSNGRCCTSVDM